MPSYQKLRGPGRMSDCGSPRTSLDIIDRVSPRTSLEGRGEYPRNSVECRKRAYPNLPEYSSIPSSMVAERGSSPHPLVPLLAETEPVTSLEVSQTSGSSCLMSSRTLKLMPHIKSNPTLLRSASASIRSIPALPIASTSTKSLGRMRRSSNDDFDDANGAPRARKKSFVDIIEELKAQAIDPIDDDAATGPAAGVAVNRKSTRVLVVDDNENNLLVMANMLRPNGFEVEMLRSGEECLEFLSARIGTDDVPDVVLLDHMMGGISGVDCCAEIRQYRGMAEHELPILLVTASESDSTMQNGFLAGATDFLQKPFALSVLLARLESALRLRELFTATVLRERDRSLLRRMLPESIIDRLESGQNLIADHHDSVTVLFSDIIGFTELSQNCSTSALMLMLNELFSAFDEALDRHGVHKVETIGDAYMCVTGHDGIGNHAERMAAFAKEMVEVCDRIKPPFQRSFGHSRSGAIDSAASGGQRKKLQIRVGMHSGPVHAGVVGTRCPRYCFFGDTVNTASRMESNSFPMAVHVSNATATLIEKGGSSVETILLGPRCIKGKGIMRTHLLRMGDYLGACKLFAELQVSEAATDASGKSTPNPAAQDTNITAQKESTLARMFDTDTWVAGSLSGEGGDASPRRPSLRNPHNDSSQVRPTHHGLFDSVDSMLARKVSNGVTNRLLLDSSLSTAVSPELVNSCRHYCCTANAMLSAADVIVPLERVDLAVIGPPTPPTSPSISPMISRSTIAEEDHSGGRLSTVTDEGSPDDASALSYLARYINVSGEDVRALLRNRATLGTLEHLTAENISMLGVKDPMAAIAIVRAAAALGTLRRFKANAIGAGGPFG
mmetsp:Transcript_26999/g.43243  ORF Transcript_26999/g.43243 Transcript_26999/m.43243 type:complete len:842 (+) Transcript_26999:338-2863(+)